MMNKDQEVLKKLRCDLYDLKLMVDQSMNDSYILHKILKMICDLNGAIKIEPAKDDPVNNVEIEQEQEPASRLTTDPNHPDLGHGSNEGPVPQNNVYLVLSEEERAKGFVNPVRHSYIHKGIIPRYSVRLLDFDERATFSKEGYVAYETYPESELPKKGRYLTQKQLDGGCGSVTTMGQELAETYARNPKFYGATYCVSCGMHLPVGEFVWDDDGTVVGSYMTPDTD